MNSNKIIKYILIAIPLLFLAKWGIETVIYDSNKIPDINPHPTQKVRIHGQFPLDENSTLKFVVTYVNNNRKCDDTNWLAGTRFPQKREATFPAKIKNGTFESTVFLDYFIPGACDYRASYIAFYFKNKKDNRHGGTNFAKFIDRSTQKHEVFVNCSEWKFDNKIYRCELEKNGYFVTRSSLDDSQQNTPSLRYDINYYNEISDSQKDIKVNIKLEGEK
ncbi:MAG: hypothetical protein RBR33_07985 [Sulfurovaceae bacterium]|nr:hypothetical protein [Sulfurovaceae bacterium]